VSSPRAREEKTLAALFVLLKSFSGVGITRHPHRFSCDYPAAFIRASRVLKDFAKPERSSAKQKLPCGFLVPAGMPLGMCFGIGHNHAARHLPPQLILTLEIGSELPLG